MTGTHRKLSVLFVSLLVATALGAGVVASQQADYAIEQGGQCYEIAPVTSANQTVEEFYGYTASSSGEGVQYSANMPIDLEKRNNGTSSLFLFEGTDGLSLVVLHGAVNDTNGGGAATLEFVGLPDDGEWVVKDDPSNLSVEDWNRDLPQGQAVDWGWRDRWTDGGAFQGGLDTEFSIEISAAFNENAALEPLAPGNVTQWRAISARDGSLQSIDLDMNDSATVRTGGC